MYHLWQFLCIAMAVEKIDRFHFGIEVVRQYQKLLPEIQKSKTKSKKKRSSWKNKTTCFHIKDRVVVLSCKKLESSNASAKLYSYQVWSMSKEHKKESQTSLCSCPDIILEYNSHMKRVVNWEIETQISGIKTEFSLI